VFFVFSVLFGVFFFFFFFVWFCGEITKNLSPLYMEIDAFPLGGDFLDDSAFTQVPQALLGSYRARMPFFKPAHGLFFSGTHRNGPLDFSLPILQETSSLPTNGVPP